MVTLSMCRICLAEDLRMQTVMNTHLEEIFQSLSLMPFATRDSRPMLACFICCAKLQNCYELRKNILRSEQLFTQILCNDVIVPPEMGGIFHKNRLKITQVVDIGIGINKQKNEHVEIEVSKPETLGVSTVKLDVPEDIVSNIKGINEQKKEHVEIEVPNPKTIDISIVKMEVPEVFEDYPLEGHEDSFSLDNVKKEKDDSTSFEDYPSGGDETNFSLDNVKKEKEDITILEDNLLEPIIVKKEKDDITRVSNSDERRTGTLQENPSIIRRNFIFLKQEINVEDSVKSECRVSGKNNKNEVKRITDANTLREIKEMKRKRNQEYQRAWRQRQKSLKKKVSKEEKEEKKRKRHRENQRAYYQRMKFKAMQKNVEELSQKKLDGLQITANNHTMAVPLNETMGLTDLLIPSTSNVLTEAQVAAASTYAMSFAESQALAARKLKALKQREYRQRKAATRTTVEAIAARKSDAERQRKRRLRKAANSAPVSDSQESTAVFDSCESLTGSSFYSGENTNDF